MISLLADKLLTANHITFFTGAGISVPSGIPDFRSPGGLWEKYNPYKYASISAFKKDPATVWVFVRELYATLNDKLPNEAHRAIYQIQQLLGKANITIITQNVDSLHQKAGSKNTIEIHGSFDVMHCIYCQYEENSDKEKHLDKMPFPVCQNCKKPLKPKAIFYEENLNNEIYNKTLNIAKNSDIIIAVGTSLEVTPASHIFLLSKGYKVSFTISSSPFDDDIDLIIKGDCERTLPQLVNILREKKQDILY